MSETPVDKIKEVRLDEQAMADYYIYGTSTIEERAIVGAVDGLKPVMRRILWSMHKLGLHHRANAVKAALIVGHCMGHHHPHGDSSIFQAAVASTQWPQPLIDGVGNNWGTMTSGSGAMRYINGRLTKYACTVFFDPFYLPTLTFIDNYDGSYKEPLNLLALLPNGLLNGNFGICPAVNTRTPAFTLPSVLKVLAAATKAGKVTEKMCEDLEWISDYGGSLAKTAANKAAVKQFMSTGVASVEWRSSYTVDEKNNTVRFNRFAPFSTSDKPAKAGDRSPIEKLLAAVEAVPGVSSIDDDSEATDPFRQAYIVRLNRTCKGEARAKVLKKLDHIFSCTQRFEVKVTDRVVENHQPRVSLRHAVVPQLLNEWLAYRVDLERKACQYWIGQRATEIQYLKLMRLAIAKLDFLFACVKNKKLNDQQLVDTIAKGLKITVEQVNQILARNLRQLRHLEDQSLVEKIKALELEIQGYDKRIKAPRAYIAKHLMQLQKELL